MNIPNSTRDTSRVSTTRAGQELLSRSWAKGTPGARSARRETAEFSVAEIHEAIAALRPDDACLVFRDRRLTWSQVTERTRRLANHFLANGLGCHTERDELAGHESGQDHVGIYLHNGNEYLEAMLGAFKARVAPFNVNYRYVDEELRYLLTDSHATATGVQRRVRPARSPRCSTTFPI